MPTIAVTSFIGTGTNKDPFRPDIDSSINRWAIFDLRSDPTVVDGRCIVVVDGDITLTSSTGEILRQTTNIGRLNRNAARLLATQMGIDSSRVEASSIGELIRNFFGESLEVRKGNRRIVILGYTLYEGI